MMNKTLVGLFSDRKEAGEVVDALKVSGIPRDNISLVAQDTVEENRATYATVGSMAKGAGSGLAAGASWGGLAGLLAGVIALSIPGVGALFIAGPIAAAIGITGTAATTISGVLTGALAGGLVGAFVGLGFSEEDAEIYERHIKSGDVMVAVTLPNKDVDTSAIRRLFEKHHAHNVHTLRERVTA